MTQGPVIVAARRTPIGTVGRELRAVTAADLAATVLAAVAADVGRPTAEVVLGNCMGPGGDVARVAGLAAGLPRETPALTVDRQCASGLAAIEVAARLVDDVERVLASVARAPIVVHAVRHPTMGQLVAVTLTDAADRPALEQHARSHLPSSHRPRAWRVVPVLPLTAGGKPDRARLQEQAG